MKPVRSIKNQYRGINAHLHSYWQSAGGWNNFHNRHIGDLAGILRQQLLPMGYTATMEESLQIQRLGEGTQQPRADILIGDPDVQRASGISASANAILTVAELVEAEEDVEKPYRAIAIYERGGVEPLGWIELLSPTNKGDTLDAQTYRAKRRVLLENHLVFVEIDYLHETPPTFSLVKLRDYTARETGSHPYRIVILDPRPDMKTGPAEPAEFDVDEAIPVVNIPLNAGDTLPFDFGACYRVTFEEMVYGLELVDYSQLPANFDRYSPADQARIVSRMLAVLDAVEKGVDLETGPFPLEPMALDAGLARFEAWRGRTG